MADPVVRVLQFEGPLDLLIQLIEKNKMDIYDIPIVPGNGVPVITD